MESPVEYTVEHSDSVNLEMISPQTPSGYLLGFTFLIWRQQDGMFDKSCRFFLGTPCAVKFWNTKESTVEGINVQVFVNFKQILKNSSR